MSGTHSGDRERTIEAHRARLREHTKDFMHGFKAGYEAATEGAFDSCEDAIEHTEAALHKCLNGHIVLTPEEFDAARKQAAPGDDRPILLPPQGEEA